MSEENKKLAFTYYQIEAVNEVLDDLAGLPSDSPAMIGDNEPIESVSLAEAIEQLKRFRDGHRNNLFIHVGYQSSEQHLSACRKQFRRGQQNAELHADETSFASN